MPILASLVAYALAGEAVACLDIGDPCSGIEVWGAGPPVFVEEIPTDGVVLLRCSGPHGGAPPRCMTWPEDQATTGDDPTTGGGGGPGTPATTGAPGDSSSGGPATGGATSPEDNGLVEHGCACASRPAAPGGALAWLLALVVAGARRRRPA